MYFTGGRLRAYERMMQEKPRHGHEPPAKPERNKDCKQHRDSDKPNGKCGQEKCVLPDE